MDFIRSLDPAGLIKGGTGVSFLLTLTTNPAPYNLPIFLLGAYVQDNTDAATSLQTFTALLGVSVPADLLWLMTTDLNWFAVLLALVLIVHKVATFFIFFNALKQRGGQFSLGGPNLAGATVWAMPGGFTSNGRDGYQTVDDEPFVRNVVRPGAPPAKPPAPLNLNDGPVAPTPPGGYQTV